MSIPFDIPAQFRAAVGAGELIQRGALLKDAATGRIVSHLQETGALQKVLQRGLSFDPTGATGLIGVAQNAAISGKLNAMQSMMGTMQVLQVASLASSVVGIGVTAASTAMILDRLNQVDEALVGIETSVADLPSKWHEMGLRSKIVTVRTSLERLQEAEVRPDAEAVIKSVEERLSYVFDEIHEGLAHVVIQVRVDACLVKSLLATLALCGSAQIKSLLWLDMKEAAVLRSRRQVAKLESLTFLMPRDLMVDRFGHDQSTALSVSQEFSEIRLRTASQPSLARTLIAREINGREYVERIEQEETEPYLLLAPA
ncbi:hypothetical protein N9741_03460 [Octadecabacter sp.]|nr:hypothetical protein [Octadecabacter sp.]